MSSDKLKIVDGLEGRLLNMDEASAFLGIKKATLYAMVMRKEIEHVKLGRLNRFVVDTLLDYVKRNTIKAQSPNTIEGF